jgi:hypothetical protein
MGGSGPGASKTVAFLFNLVQDANVLRGLVYLTARETDARIVLLVSQGFLKRDRQLIWQQELAALAADVGASMYLYATADEACAALTGARGLIFAASESNLAAHCETGDVFRAAPSDYLRITLQHGLECVGFLQSREHVLSHGRNVSFAADVVCSWFEPESLTSMVASERSKLVVTGPPFLLHRPVERRAGDRAGGLVCENMHSVRLRASGDHKTSFMDIFFAFCAKLAEQGEAVTLRPHPGGQYVLKNKVALPDNVALNMDPLYAVGLGQYRFGISAPSTIVLDLVLAGVPVGVWRDGVGVMDASAYDGLTEISSLDDWLGFERDVRLRPDFILARQEAFLRRLAMPTDPEEIYRRFARLIVAGLERIGASPPAAGGGVPALRPIQLSGQRLVQVAT